MTGKARQRSGERFDKAYYDRFYLDPRTRVVSEQEIDRLADFVFAYLRHLGLPVHRVLDMGCGLGLWQAAVRRHVPPARYTGVEISPYLCERFGWKPGSVVDFEDRTPHDLVICQGVLQYLTAPKAREAIQNLGRLTRGALYLEALTREDWEEHCDRERTDGDVKLRRAAWYRRLLSEDFQNAGGGLWLRRGSDAVLYALEGGS